MRSPPTLPPPKTLEGALCYDHFNICLSSNSAERGTKQTPLLSTFEAAKPRLHIPFFAHHGNERNYYIVVTHTNFYV